MAYITLKNGSSGEEVTKLQNTLMDAGYDVGSAGADGIYGSATESAVRKYQQDNGLDADGVAGDQTLGKLYDTKTTTTQSQTETAPYNPQADSAYQKAIAALTQARENAPTYKATYDAQLQDVYDQIVNRDKFSYDVNADSLYSQYAEQYARQGEMAMEDTMARAMAATGGYGSSYAQTVGQQTYNNYLQQLNDIVPQLYDRALAEYNAEGDRLLNQYAMLGDMADTEYGRYQDALNNYWQNISYLEGKEETEYNRQQDAYDRLVSLMTSVGYAPSDAQLAAAGMTDEEKQAYMDYYLMQTGGGSGGYSGGGSGGGYSGDYGGYDGYEYDDETGEADNDVVDRGNASGFTGTTYSEAVAYMKAAGVPSEYASSIMTADEFYRAKESNKNTVAKEYTWYKDYLADEVDRYTASV